VIFNAATVDIDLDAEIQVAINVDNDNSMHKCRTVTVRNLPSEGNRPPIAAAHAETEGVNAGDQVRFYDDSTDPDGDDNILEWAWDFSYDDSDVFQSESEFQEPSHVYLDVGTRLVQLQVTDSEDLADFLERWRREYNQIRPHFAGRSSSSLFFR